MTLVDLQDFLPISEAHLRQNVWCAPPFMTLSKPRDDVARQFHWQNFSPLATPPNLDSFPWQLRTLC